MDILFPDPHILCVVPHTCLCDTERITLLLIDYIGFCYNGQDLSGLSLQLLQGGVAVAGIKALCYTYTHCCCLHLNFCSPSPALCWFYKSWNYLFLSQNFTLCLFGSTFCKELPCAYILKAWQWWGLPGFVARLSQRCKMSTHQVSSTYL